MTSPAITVLMPLFNASRHLDEAVDSILRQTCADFELIAVDDGSTDDGAARLIARADPRIRLERLPRNMGVVAALNHGLALARGEYVARMDADDIAEPVRLEKQLAHMRAHPEICALGSAFTFFGEKSGPGWVRWFDAQDINIALLFENPLCHPSVMLRRDTLIQNGLVYPDVPYAEEYALWVALSRLKPIANHPESLLRYRAHPQQISRLRNDIQCASMDRIMIGQLARLGIGASPSDLMIHKLLGGSFNPVPGYEKHLACWSARLVKANENTGVYPREQFVRQIDQRHETALAFHKERLGELSLLRQIAWRFASWRDFRRAGRPSSSLP